MGNSIDPVLAQHYGFTDEELDFIINYDIKYRMGRDAEEEGDEDGSEAQPALPGVAAAPATPAPPPAPAPVKAESKAAPAPAPAQTPAAPTFAALAPERPSQQTLEPRPRQATLADGPARPSSLRAGDRVRHHIFGEGEVVGVEMQGGDEVVTIQFGRVGKKKLSVKLAKLERLD